MPFNRELEDFAQAFSTGYGMVKSKEEREAEKLTLEGKRLEVERLPTQYAHEDIKFGLDVDIAKGQLSDAEAARKRLEITQKYEDQNQALKAQFDQGLIDKQTRDAEQAKIDEARAAETHKIDMAVKGLELEDLQHKQGRREKIEADADKLTDLQLQGAGLDIIKKKEDNALAPARAKEANALADSAAAKAKLDKLAASPESIARNEEIKKWELKKAQADADLQAASAEAKRLEISNTFNAADFYNNLGGSDVDFGATQAVPEGPANSTGIDAQGNNIGAGPRIGGTVPGPTSAVDVEPTVAQRAQEGETVSSFNPPGLNGPYEGAGAGPEPVAPSEAAPEEAVPVEGQALLLNGSSPDRLQPPQAPVVPPPAPIVGREDPAQNVLKKAKNGGKVTIPDLIDIGIKVTPEALKNSAEMSGLMGNESAVDTPESDERHANWLQGGNGADPETAEMVLATMDEATDGKLNPKEKFMATVGAGYMFHLAKGDAAGAKNYAIGMVEYGRHLAGQYSAFAKAAAHNGDPDATAMAAMRAYAHVGNGKVLDVSRAPDGEHFIAHITDLKSGKTILKQLMTPDEVMAQAMKTTPDAVVPEMLSAAGIEDKTISSAAAEALHGLYPDIPVEQFSSMTVEEANAYQQGKEARLKRTDASRPKPLSVDDLQQASTMIDTAFSSLRGEDPNLAKVTRDPTVQQVLSQSEENYSSDFKRAAMDIMAQNPNTLPDTAVEAASNMMFKHVDMKPVAKKEGDTNEYVEIRAPGLPPLVVNRAYYRTMVAIRSKMLNEAVQQAGDEVQDQQDARKSWNKAASDAAKLFGVGEVKAPSEKELQESIQETIGRPGDITERAKQSGMHSEAVPTTPMEPAYVPPKSVIPQDGKTWYERVFSY